MCPNASSQLKKERILNLEIVVAMRVHLHDQSNALYGIDPSALSLVD
jgi:hypothetical protein